MRFTAEQHRIWSTLSRRQFTLARRYACREYLEGTEILALPLDRIPSLHFLNRRIRPRTGWKAVRTLIRYSEAQPWYQAFARKEFLITDYMRGWDELDFTPEPDMFHDIFGHLPFMVLPRYTELQEMFAPAFQRAGTREKLREDIKRLAWFSTEFGLIQEKGNLRVFGAGLISSAGEIENVMAGSVPVLPFKIQNVLKRDKAIYSYNDVLFVFDSLDALKAELASYFDTL